MQDEIFRESQKDNALRELIFILFDRSKVVLSIFCVFFFLSIALAFLLPPVYRASAKFFLSSPQQLDPLQKETFYDSKNHVMRLIQDQKEIIFSNRVLNKVVEKVYGNIRPEEVPEKIQDIKEDMEVTPPKGETFEGSSVFYINFSEKNPQRAAQIAQAISDAYLEISSEISRLRTDYSHEFFQQQAQQLYDRMVEKENILRQYEAEKATSLVEILNLDPGKTNLEVGLSALLTQSMGKRSELQEELAGIKTVIDLLEKEATSEGIPAILPDMEGYGRTISAFKNKVAQLQIQLNEMKSQYEKNYSPIQQVEAELKLSINSLREELLRTVQGQEIAANNIEAKIKEHNNNIESLDTRIRQVAEERSAYEHLKQEYVLAKDAYTSAHNQEEQARLASALNQEKESLTVVDQPTVPSKSYKPNKPFLIIMGFFSGLLLGIASALMLDHFDHTLKRPQDVEKFLDLPVIGTIPRVA